MNANVCGVSVGGVRQYRGHVGLRWLIGNRAVPAVDIHAVGKWPLAVRTGTSGGGPGVILCGAF